MATDKRRGKRAFRPRRTSEDSARYPLEGEGRRAFLRRLAGGLAGAALLGVGACGGRAAKDPPPSDTAGAPNDMHAPLDAGPDFPTATGGTPDAMPAPLDSGGVPDSIPAPLDGKSSD